LELTKLDLAQYYERIAEWILPHLVNRPLTMVRCPTGRAGQCFYQKHLAEKMPAALRGVSIKEKSATRQYVVIDDLAGLVTLVQRGVLEIHPWGSTADDLEHPDRLVIDLDPGEGAIWKAVIHGAHEVKEYLEGLNLTSFVRTTGGKGLHVVAPLVAGATWEQHKEFAATIAQTLTARSPALYLATMSKAQRKG
jgi:bifunctional non-homologous end joining protein LigD